MPYCCPITTTTTTPSRTDAHSVQVSMNLAPSSDTCTIGTVDVSPVAKLSTSGASRMALNKATAYPLMSNSSCGGDGGSGPAHTPASIGTDVLVVVVLLTCMLLVFITVLLISTLRLVRRVAAVVAAAEGDRAKTWCLHCHGEKVKLRDSSRMQLGGDNHGQRGLVPHLKIPQGAARPYRRITTSRHRWPGLRGARRRPLGISSVSPTALDARKKETTSLQHQSKSGPSSSAAARDQTSGFAAPALQPPAPAPAPALRTAAPIGPYPAQAVTKEPTEWKTGLPVTANHRETQYSRRTQLPAFTATTEKDMVVYNTTHESRYGLLRRIGMGAFSSVYLVQHKTTGKKYALKYILCRDYRQRQMALRECDTIHSLQGHPQVIRIVDMFMGYQFQSTPASPTAEDLPIPSRTPSETREPRGADAKGLTTRAITTAHGASDPPSLQSRIHKSVRNTLVNAPAAVHNETRPGHVNSSRVGHAASDPREALSAHLAPNRLYRTPPYKTPGSGDGREWPCDMQHPHRTHETVPSSVCSRSAEMIGDLQHKNSAPHDRPAARDIDNRDEREQIKPIDGAAGGDNTDSPTPAAIAARHCPPSATHTTAACSSSNASRQQDRLDDSGDDVHGRGRHERIESGMRERTTAATQPCGEPMDDRCCESSHDVEAKYEARSADLRGKVAHIDEDLSCREHEVQSSASNSSGTQEEPVQPVYRTAVPPPPPPSCADPQLHCGMDLSRTCCSNSENGTLQHDQKQHTPIPAETSPPASNRYANFSMAPAEATPALAESAVASHSARLSLTDGVLAENVCGHPCATASNAPSASAWKMNTIILERHASQPSQQPARVSYAPQLQQQQRTQSMSSSVDSYAPLRVMVPTGGVSSCATSLRSVEGPTLYKDVVQSPTTVIDSFVACSGQGAGMQAHQLPSNHRGSPAPPLYGASDPSMAQKEAAAIGGVGLVRNPETGAYVNPYLTQALSEEQGQSSRASYAPSGGVHYSRLIVPGAAVIGPSTSSMNRSPAEPSSGPDISASRRCYARHEEGCRPEGTDSEKSSQAPYTLASVPHSAGCLVTPQPLARASPTSEMASRHTYAPLRYGNMMQTGPVLPVTPSVENPSTMSPPPLWRGALMQASPAASLAASHTPDTEYPIVSAAIRAARAQQAEARMGLSSGTLFPRSSGGASETGTTSSAKVMCARNGEERVAVPLAKPPQLCLDTPPPAGLLPTGVQPSSPPHARSIPHAGDEASKKKKMYDRSEGEQCASVQWPVRYANAENPKLWREYSEGTAPVDSAAAAAAVAALMGVPPKVSAGPPPMAAAHEHKISAAASTTTQHDRGYGSSSYGSSSRVQEDVRDSGYLCLVMEYHPMGDLCRYALRTKEQLRRLHSHRHHQLQPTWKTRARDGVPDRTGWQATTENDPTGHDRGLGTKVRKPSSLPLSYPSSSSLAAAAAATWTMKPTTTQKTLPQTLSAGVGRRGSTSRNSLLDDIDDAEHAHDLDSHRKAAATATAIDPTMDNPLTEPQLLSIAYQLASVLDHMHRQNPPIVHRDLKPENILIKGDISDYLEGPVSPSSIADESKGGSVADKPSVSQQSPSSTTQAHFCTATASELSSSSLSLLPLPPIRITRAVVPIALTDFGLAVPQDTDGRSCRSRGGGTRPYIAPECWHGETCTASDVWSLGCVLYALATCRLVSKDVRIMSQEAKQYGFASRMLNDILAHNYSLALASFVVSLLVVDPAKRPTAEQVTQCFCFSDEQVRFDLNSPFFSNVLDL